MAGDLGRDREALDALFSALDASHLALELTQAVRTRPDEYRVRDFRSLGAFTRKAASRAEQEPMALATSRAMTACRDLTASLERLGHHVADPSLLALHIESAIWPKLLSEGGGIEVYPRIRAVVDLVGSYKLNADLGRPLWSQDS